MKGLFPSAGESHRPRRIGELEKCRRLKISHVLSLLDPGTPAPPELDRLFDPVELRFHDVIDALPRAKPPVAELITLGAKVVNEGCCTTSQMADAAVSRQMFADILSLIAQTMEVRFDAVGTAQVQRASVVNRRL
jgi:hypothetical protein